MVDIQTNKIIDMLESRETEDVCRCLSQYPNLAVISRDGSQTYAAAITGAHPSAMQVRDRFHILKNLNERATQTFQKLFQGRIGIPMISGTQGIRYETLIGNSADRARLIKRLCGEGRTKGEIALLTRIVKKYAELPMCEIPDELQTVRGREHEDAVKKLTERANRVKALR